MEASIVQKDDSLQEAGEVSQTFFVAPDGDDRGDGTMEHPFATIERAIGAAANSRDGGDEILLREGTYYPALPLELSEKGTPQRWSRLAAWAGERAVIDGHRIPDAEDGPQFDDLRPRQLLRALESRARELPEVCDQPLRRARPGDRQRHPRLDGRRRVRRSPPGGLPVLRRQRRLPQLPEQPEAQHAQRLDPRLVDPGGRRACDFALRPDSPAIEAGTRLACTSTTSATRARSAPATTSVRTSGARTPRAERSERC